VLSGAMEVQADSGSKNASLAFTSESEEILGLEATLPQQTTILIDTDK